jgi:CHASE3 domain sensor protein
MVESISNEVSEMYSKKKSEMKEKVDSMRKELQTTIEYKRNESFKEV